MPSVAANNVARSRARRFADCPRPHSRRFINRIAGEEEIHVRCTRTKGPSSLNRVRRRERQGTKSRSRIQFTTDAGAHYCCAFVQMSFHVVASVTHCRNNRRNVGSLLDAGYLRRYLEENAERGREFLAEGRRRVPGRCTDAYATLCNVRTSMTDATTEPRRRINNRV